MKKILLILQLFQLMCLSLQTCSLITDYRGVQDLNIIPLFGYYGQKMYFDICVNISSVTWLDARCLYHYSSCALVIMNSNITTLTRFIFIPRHNDYDNEYDHVYNIELGHNFISFVEKDAFNSFTGLQKVNLQYNNISSLPDELFAFNTKLSALDLSYNAISSVKNATFSSHSLRYLNLAHNNLQKLNFNLPESLLILNISFNSLSDLSNYPFIGMTNMTTLSLENNQLKSIPTGCFKDLHSLTELFLSNNKIHVTLGTFTGLHNLRTLSIANNSLEDLSGITLHFLDKLKTLNVANNSITIFNIGGIKDVFRSLNKIDISGNTFNCAYLKKILVGFAEKGVTVEGGPEHYTSNIKGIACTAFDNETKQIQQQEKDSEGFLKKSSSIEERMVHILEEINGKLVPPSTQTSSAEKHLQQILEESNSRLINSLKQTFNVSHNVGQIEFFEQFLKSRNINFLNTSQTEDIVNKSSSIEEKMVHILEEINGKLVAPPTQTNSTGKNLQQILEESNSRLINSLRQAFNISHSVEQMGSIITAESGNGAVEKTENLDVQKFIRKIENDNGNNVFQTVILVTLFVVVSFMLYIQYLKFKMDKSQQVANLNEMNTL